MMHPGAVGGPARTRLRYSDEDFLRFATEERRRSVGFGDGDGGELAAARERALAYYRGDVSRDVPTIPNRSAAVSTDIAEAVETALPDIVEIFVGGDDAATFLPVGPEDEAAAQQETDFVNHVVFNENNGFLAFYTAFKDALLTRTGLFTWWWEESEKVREERFEGKTLEEVAVALETAQAQGATCRYEARDDGLFDVVVRSTRNLGRVCVKAVPPEDFTVAPDAVTLKEATYCALRDRPRVQDLIARGVDPGLARGLPAYAEPEGEVAQARDLAGEREANALESLGDLRQVEVRAHYIRLDADGDGQLELWRVVTDADERTLIEKAQVEAVPFGAITPYLNGHRFYGESVADRLIEIQKIKTTLLRMLLDSGYFALNQRAEVSMAEANEYTIADLLRNEPNMPVRSKTGRAVRPIGAGAINFDIFGALEHVSVRGEQRTGIVRNAQGLKPGTLHDTARGALALMSMAQKRVRLIARIFAETGVKDMFLGVHALIRRHATAAAKARLKGRWVEVDPTCWGERKDMTIQIGLGSAGRDHDLAAMAKVLEIQREVVELQGGVHGPFVTPDNIHNALKRFVMAAGQRAPELFFADPRAGLAAGGGAGPPGGTGRGRAQVELAMARAKAAGELKLKGLQIAAGAKMREREIELNAALRERQIARELELKERQLAAEMALEEKLALSRLAAGLGGEDGEVATSPVELGGDPG